MPCTLIRALLEATRIQDGAEDDLVGGMKMLHYFPIRQGTDDADNEYQTIDDADNE